MDSPAMPLCCRTVSRRMPIGVALDAEAVSLEFGIGANR
jgi:hypothetical protein